MYTLRNNALASIEACFRVHIRTSICCYLYLYWQIADENMLSPITVSVFVKLMLSLKFEYCSLSVVRNSSKSATAFCSMGTP
jgi:hypothetical protein